MPPGWFGPPPPSGMTQLMFWVGFMMSQLLPCTQFCALISKRGLMPSSLRTISYSPAGQ